MYYCYNCQLVDANDVPCPSCGAAMIEADDDYIHELQARADFYGYEALTDVEQALIA